MAASHLRALARDLIALTTHRLPAPYAPHPASLHRLLSSATSWVSPFDAEDYLVASCGLTRSQALKASAKISHLTSRSNPDSVLAFLRSTLGIPADGVAALVAMDPKSLCLNVERTLAPSAAELARLGLSRDSIARLITISPGSFRFRTRFLGRNVEFWLKELGSVDELLRVVRFHNGLLRTDLDKVVKPNVAFLQQCGLNVLEIAGLNKYSARLFTMNIAQLRDAVERVEELGVNRGGRMFARTLGLIAIMRREVVTQRIQFLSKFGFSQDELLLIVRRAPTFLSSSEKRIQRNVDFLMKDVGLNASYIARRPALLLYSLERRLLPRHCLLKVLREKGVLKAELDYYSATVIAEKMFVQKFVLPYKDVIVGLGDGYASITEAWIH